MWSHAPHGRHRHRQPGAIATEHQRPPGPRVLHETRPIPAEHEVGPVATDVEGGARRQRPQLLQGRFGEHVQRGQVEERSRRERGQLQAADRLAAPLIPAGGRPVDELLRGEALDLRPLFLEGGALGRGPAQPHLPTQGRRERGVDVRGVAAACRSVREGDLDGSARPGCVEVASREVEQARPAARHLGAGHRPGFDVDHGIRPVADQAVLVDPTRAQRLAEHGLDRVAMDRDDRHHPILTAMAAPRPPANGRLTAATPPR